MKNIISKSLRTFILSAFILFPAICSAQTSAFIMGGISAGKSISPSGEAGFYCEFNRFKVGMNFTYTHIKIKQDQSAILDNPATSIGHYTAAISLGPVLNAGNIKIMPAAEMGAVFSDKDNGAFLGIRTDIKYNLNKRLYFISGIHLNHSRLKTAVTNYGARAGISIAL